MELGLSVGYWSAGPPEGAAELVAKADDLDSARCGRGGLRLRRTDAAGLVGPEATIRTLARLLDRR